MRDDFSLFTGTANPDLADSVARHLSAKIGDCTIDRYPDGEVVVQLLEPVRRKEVFLVQPISPPVNDHLIELVALADACRRAAADRITAIVPYCGYGRADKRHSRREPITGRVVADLLQVTGITHVITVDLHAPQIEGFFHIPVDTLSAVRTLCGFLRGRLPPDVVVVSPDAGRMQIAAEYAEWLGTQLVVLHKWRISGEETAVTHISGDVQDRPCLIIDDIISTGGTIASSIEALLDAGARAEFYIAATHGLLLSGAREKLDRAAVNTVLVSDTVHVPERHWPKLEIVSVAPVIATAVERLLADGSMADLYEDETAVGWPHEEHKS